MSKGKSVKFDYIEGYGTVCEIVRKGVHAIGTAYCKEEDFQTKLVGETIAYYKAERDYSNQMIAKQKEKIKQVKDFATFLFPERCGSSPLITRYEKWLRQEEEKLRQLEEKRRADSEWLTNYCVGRKIFIDRVRKKRAAREEKEVTTEPQN